MSNGVKATGAKLKQIEAELRGEGSPIPFATSRDGGALVVKLVKDWPLTAIEALSAGQLSSWAAKALEGDGSAKWVAMDPTISEAVDFFKAYVEITGVDPKELVASLL